MDTPLWLIVRTDHPQVGEPAAFVVAAATEDLARKESAANCGGEGGDVWSPGTASACKPIEFFPAIGDNGTVLLRAVAAD